MVVHTFHAMENSSSHMESDFLGIHREEDQAGWSRPPQAENVWDVSYNRKDLAAKMHEWELDSRWEVDPLEVVKRCFLDMAEMRRMNADHIRFRKDTEGMGKGRC